MAVILPELHSSLYDDDEDDKSTTVMMMMIIMMTAIKLIIMVKIMRIMMTWTIWCSFNQSKIDGRSFWEAFLEWRTICTWSFLFSLPIICFLQWSFLFSDVDEALAATKERLIYDVCGNVVGANICNSSILIYITEKSDEDNIYIMYVCLSQRIVAISVIASFHLFVTLFPHCFLTLSIYVLWWSVYPSVCHSWGRKWVKKMSTKARRSTQE